MKRTLWIILALGALIVVLCCGTAMAARTGSLNDDIRWSLDESAGTLAITGKGAMPNYSASGTNLSPFQGNKKINKVEIDAGVTNVGNFLFLNCSNLSSVTVRNPNAVFGSGVFYGCYSEMTLNGWMSSTTESYAQKEGFIFNILCDRFGSCGDNVHYSFYPETGVLRITGTGPMWDYNNATDSPFYENIAITDVSIYGGVTSIGSYAFEGCTGMTYVEIDVDSGVTSIGSYAFKGCSSLTSVTIPRNVTSIGYEAFSRCSGLANVTIGSSVTSIGDRSFSFCSGLTSVTIPGNVISIGDYSFYKCSSLKKTMVLNSSAEFGAEVSAIPPPASPCMAMRAQRQRPMPTLMGILSAVHLPVSAVTK